MQGTGLLDHIAACGKRDALHDRSWSVLVDLRCTEAEPMWAAGANRCCTSDLVSDKRNTSKHVDRQRPPPLQGTACRGSAMLCRLEQTCVSVAKAGAVVTCSTMESGPASTPFSVTLPLRIIQTNATLHFQRASPRKRPQWCGALMDSLCPTVGCVHHQRRPF